MSAIVLVYVKGIRSHSLAIYRFIGLGALAAIAALIHPALLPMVAGIVAGQFLAIHGKHLFMVTSLRAVAIVAGFVLVLSPWLARNYALTGRPVASVDTAGFTYFASQVAYNGTLKPNPFEFSEVASHLNVSVADLDVQYFTIKDEYNARLNKLAAADIVTGHWSFLNLAKRCTIQIIWLWLGAEGLMLSAAHLVYLLPIFALLTRAIARGFFLDVLVMLIVIVPTTCVHLVSMNIIPHATYSMPLLVPILVAAAICSKGALSAGILRDNRESSSDGRNTAVLAK